MVKTDVPGRQAQKTQLSGTEGSLAERGSLGQPELSVKVRRPHSEGSPEVPGTLTCRQVKEGVAASQHRSWSSEGEVTGKHMVGGQPPSGEGQGPGLRAGWGGEGGEGRGEGRVEEDGWGQR